MDTLHMFYMLATYLLPRQYICALFLLGASKMKGDDCWEGDFNAEVCCDLRVSPKGRPECWDGHELHTTKMYHECIKYVTKMYQNVAEV